jgi:hypothetical protein
MERAYFRSQDLEYYIIIEGAYGYGSLLRIEESSRDCCESDMVFPGLLGLQLINLFTCI